MALQEIVDNFEFLDDWEDKYRYVIDLGRDMPPFPEDKKTAEHKVDGCVSQVWLLKEVANEDSEAPILSYQGDSDAHIVKGLVAIVLASFSGQKAQAILEFDTDDLFRKIGLAEHLTPQRANGLRSMVARIKSDAAQALESA